MSLREAEALARRLGAKVERESGGGGMIFDLPGARLRVNARRKDVPRVLSTALRRAEQERAGGGE